MEFRKVRALRGPNIWANSPVIEAWLDLKHLEATSSADVPGFVERLMAWLPGLIEHECSEGRRGGFLERLRLGTYPAHILEHVVLELQNLAGSPVRYGRARETPEAGVYYVVFKYRDEEVAKACLETGRLLILAALDDEPFDVPGEVAKLRTLAERVGAGPTTVAILEAAKARGIPALRISASYSNSLLQLGHGARQRRMYASATDRTGAVAVSITSDKELTKTLLGTVGVPVPEGLSVADAEEAWEAACELGLPVVVKPQSSDNGLGVSVNLRTREQVLAAYAEAREEGPEVLVERFVPGDTYRVLVVEGRVVAAARREVAHVIGDGRSTVMDLIDRANRDPRRRDVNGPAKMPQIEVGENTRSVLADQGYSTDSIPRAGVRVRLRRRAMLTNGGTVVDVTDEVHPEVAARAIDAARVSGLDVAGIDVVAEEIGRPLEEQGGVVVEVNSHPGLQLHLAPWCATPRPVAEAIVSALFPDGETGRIPIAAITGVNGKTTTTRLIAHIIRGTGASVGMACTDGLYVNDRRIDRDDCAGPRSARSLLMNPAVEVAVLEAARGGILRAGLGFDKCDVAVVTNIGEGDHLGLDFVRSPEDLIRVKRTVVDVVLPTGWAVLNAADPLVSGMAEHCRGGVVYFAQDGSLPLIRDHRSRGGRAVFVEDGQVVRAEGQAAESLISLLDVPLTHGGAIGFQVENVLAAAAAAWSLDVPPPALRAGLTSFRPSPEVVPGRFNVLDAGDATVIVDFGHNPSALASLVRSLDDFRGQRRTVVLSADGDRRDEVIVRQAEIVAPHFERVWLYDEPRRARGRAPGEIPALLRRGLLASPGHSQIDEVEGESTAIARAIADLKPGDVSLILVDDVETSLSLVQQLLSERRSRMSSVRGDD